MVLELRGRRSHAGVPLIHLRSESVVLANVFGTLRHLPPTAVLAPWLAAVSGGAVPAGDDWAYSFWERQERPVEVQEESTEVDVVLSSEAALVFVEVKLDADASPGTASEPERDQLSRNLDVGARRAAREGRPFFLVYVTPDGAAPPLVERLRAGAPNLFWSSWSAVAATAAAAYTAGALGSAEAGLTLDLLAYCVLRAEGAVGEHPARQPPVLPRQAVPQPPEVRLAVRRLRHAPPGAGRGVAQ
jgi:hypothetical protein